MLLYYDSRRPRAIAGQMCYIAYGRETPLPSINITPCEDSTFTASVMLRCSYDAFSWQYAQNLSPQGVVTLLRAFANCPEEAFKEFFRYAPPGTTNTYKGPEEPKVTVRTAR